MCDSVWSGESVNRISARCTLGFSVKMIQKPTVGSELCPAISVLYYLPFDSICTFFTTALCHCGFSPPAYQRWDSNEWWIIRCHSVQQLSRSRLKSDVGETFWKDVSATKAQFWWCIYIKKSWSTNIVQKSDLSQFLETTLSLQMSWELVLLYKSEVHSKGRITSETHSFNQPFFASPCPNKSLQIQDVSSKESIHFTSPRHHPGLSI